MNFCFHHLSVLASVVLNGKTQAKSYLWIFILTNSLSDSVAVRRNAALNGRRIGIVGAGIVGLAHAWSAAERQCEATVFERTSRASGGSVRNFGMVWPIGQPAGECYATAMMSRKRWLRLSELARIWVNPCGSIHLAHHEDEWAVLQEYAARASDFGVDCRLLTPTEVHQRTSAANPDGLRGGLFSPTELCVNPCQAVRTMPTWL